MNEAKSKLNKLMDELSEEKREIRAKLELTKTEVLEGWDKVEETFHSLKDDQTPIRVKMHLAKLELLEGWDKIIDKLDENKPDLLDLKVRMHLAKLNMLEEWDEIEEKSGQLKEKADSLIDVSEDKFMQGLDMGKRLGHEIKTLLSSIRKKAG